MLIWLLLEYFEQSCTKRKLTGCYLNPSDQPKQPHRGDRTVISNWDVISTRYPRSVSL